MWFTVGLTIVVCSVIVVLSNLIHGGEHDLDHRPSRFKPKSTDVSSQSSSKGASNANPRRR